VAATTDSDVTTSGQVLVVGAITGLLYGAVYVAQRAIFRGPDGPGYEQGIVLYTLSTVVLFGTFVRLLSLSRRTLTFTARLLAICFPLGFYLFWIPVAPVFSSDVFSYVWHGYVRAGLGENPYLETSSAVAAQPIGHDLAAYGWVPVQPQTPYGPLVTRMEAAAVAMADGDVRLSYLYLKLMTGLAGLGIAWLIWMVLSKVRPDDRDLGMLAFLWNPVMVMEVAGEGHNDSVMTLLVLTAILLTLSQKAVWVMVALAAGVITKYLPVLFLPLQVAHLWRVSGNRNRLVGRLAFGAVLGLGLAVASFTSFWVGERTFEGVRLSGRTGHTGSTQTVGVELLSRVVSDATAERVLLICSGSALVFLVIWAAARVTDGFQLLRMSANVALIYTLVLAPTYWPWYVIMPVALLTLMPDKRNLVLVVVISLGSRLVAPLNSLYVDSVIDRPAFLLLTWLGGVAVPLVVLLFSHSRSDRRAVWRGPVVPR
jgi:alpha-1,6-mannosyltransferase